MVTTEKNRRVYMFIAHMGVGGAERVCVTLANEMTNRGREVHIVVLNLDNDVNTHLLSKKCIVHSLNVSRLRYAALAMLRFVRKEKPESMLVFGSEMGIILNQLRKLHLVNIKIVQRVLNNVNISLKKEDNISPIVESYLKKQQKQLGDMDYVVAQCRSMEEMLLERELVSEDKVKCIYNPYNDKLVDLVEKARTKGHFDIRACKKVYFIGRLDPQKNLQDLIQAFASVLKYRDDVELHLVGDGLLVDKLKELTKKMGISDKVIFEGLRKDMENVYAVADLVVLSSEYEGMPNCLIEAIASGIPIVSYDCPIGPAEIVVDGQNGYLVPFMDKKQLAKKILLALEKSWDREMIKETADKFKATHITAHYLEVLDKVVS